MLPEIHDVKQDIHHILIQTRKFAQCPSRNMKDDQTNRFAKTCAAEPSSGVAVPPSAQDAIFVAQASVLQSPLLLCAMQRLSSVTL
jgi:hypothetical protein